MYCRFCVRVGLGRVRPRVRAFRPCCLSDSGGAGRLPPRQRSKLSRLRTDLLVEGGVARQVKWTTTKQVTSEK